MSVTSTYLFPTHFFSNMFMGINLPDPGPDKPFKQTIGGSAALIVTRPKAEVVIDLKAPFNAPAVIGEAAILLLSAGASLTSDIRVQGVPWFEVPYFAQNAAAHQPFDMLARVNFDFHRKTPWFCSDIDGTVSFYLFFFRDASGFLHGHVDGNWFQLNGGWPACSGPMADALKKALPGIQKQVEQLLQAALAQASGIKFKEVYLLPGDGKKTQGTFLENANLDAALGLVPA
jgi:hypothetical protein